MTTSTTTSTSASSASDAARRPRTNGSPGARYAIANLRITLAKTAYIVFVIAMPLVMFLLFNQIYGKQDSGNGVAVGAWIMINMAAYGALGAAMNSGATLQMERRSGWFRQLSVAGLSGRDFILGKVFSALVLMLPTIALIFAAGAITGVRLDSGQWLRCGLLIWVCTLPMILCGLAIALWFSAEAAQPANTIILMVLAILGGLWFPAQMFPHAMKLVSYCTPTYWIQRFSSWPLDSGPFPWHGLITLGAWTIGLLVLAAVGFRRAARTSKR